MFSCIHVQVILLLQHPVQHVPSGVLAGGNTLSDAKVFLNGPHTLIYLHSVPHYSLTADALLYNKLQ